MTFPKGKLLALVTIVAALGIVTATGAFTTVSAERTAEVSVAGDGAALLQLSPTDGPNGQYAGYDGNVFQIDFSAVGDVNDEAETDVQEVFTITNQGTQNVTITIADSDTDGGTTTDGIDAVTFYSLADHGAEAANGDLEDGTFELGTGETVNVSVYVDTVGFNEDDGDGGDLVDTIEITAQAVEA